MFVKYNSVLRGIKGDEMARQRMNKLTKGNTYTTTLHCINSCLVKLGKLTKAAKVYRGISGGLLPEEFWKANTFGVRGGVEFAFTSTTLERDVAEKYASTGKVGMILEIQQGMVDRGAELEWLSQVRSSPFGACTRMPPVAPGTPYAPLRPPPPGAPGTPYAPLRLPMRRRSPRSQYPAEKEICFAPLTGIEVQNTRVEGNVLVVEARLSVNLTALTIEQVVAKMQRSQVQLLNTMIDDLRFGGAPQPALAPLDALRSELSKRDASFFNEADNFLAATKVRPALPPPHAAECIFRAEVPPCYHDREGIWPRARGEIARRARVRLVSRRTRSACSTRSSSC